MPAELVLEGWEWFVANRNDIWIVSFVLVILLTADNKYDLIPYATRNRRLFAAGIIFLTVSLAWLYASGGVEEIISRISGVAAGIVIGSLVALDKAVDHVIAD